jgi:hypothetical protein
MCERIDLPGGGSALVCGLRAFRKFCACGRQADFLCDWKVSARKSGTCDNPICSRHSRQVAPMKHLCPEHQKQFDAWKLRHPERRFTVEQQRSLFEEAA